MHILVGHRDETLDGLASHGATTGLWRFRLWSSFADPTVVGKLSGPVASLPEDIRARFPAQLFALPSLDRGLSLRDMAWPVALLRTRHRASGRSRLLGPWSRRHNDVGPNLRAAAEADGVAFHAL